MQGRQSGVTMAEMMSIADEGEDAGFIKSIIIAAYERPRYRSPSGIEREVREFQNDIYLECFKSWAVK